ncbi:MAG TPA: TonB-dependent receptor [Thermoanaerobaculia bacterium]|nr:TonB-dependent receptor [Thermoanaerobaculia bacterium]
MKLTRYLLTFMAIALVSVSGAFAQGTQTAILTGTVAGPDGIPLPGVTVSASSPGQIGGARTTVSGSNGDYILRGLAPGQYTVTFELGGMQTTSSTTMLPLGGTTRLDATMRVAVTAETITVTGETPSALETQTIATNVTKEQVDQLPVVRTPTGIGSLSVAVTDRTPVGGQLSISGGMAFDNSILVNGVNVQDPIFGSTNNLFIEDSILETQVLTSGISAEYGSFTGGVLNVITKSGSNEFAGSLRANLTKPGWRDETPFEKERNTTREGDMAEVYEATLGGPVLRDRLWFFGAGRDEEGPDPVSLAGTGTFVPRVRSNRRLEGKLTANLFSNHTFQGSYIENPVEATHEIQVGPLELQAVGRNSLRLNEGFVFNYNGVLANNLFAEARYSEKKFGFRGLGGTLRNIEESPMRSLGRHSAPFRNTGGTFNAPYFDATDPEDRNNDQLYGALSYFLSTSNLGSHDIKGGVERFTVTRTGGNSQTATDYVFYTSYVAAGTSGTTPLLDSSGRMIPRFFPGAVGQTRIGNWISTRGVALDTTTDSIYLNDRWDLNANWTITLGVRHEWVKAETEGLPNTIQPVDTSATVPRLGASYDPFGNGRFKFDLTYAEYAGRYNPAITGDITPVGTPALLYGYYTGPEGTGRDFAPGFDLSNYVFYYASVPTGNQFVEPGLSSPINEEITLSAGMALARGGWIKASYVERELGNFIEDFITIDQGCSQIVFGGIDAGCFDNVILRNSNAAKREYKALQFQARYGIMRNWMVEGNYTHQLRNHGNYEGEAGQSIPSGTPLFNRPEIQSPREYPTGRLAQFQEHKVRMWTTYNLGLGRAGNLGLGLIYRYDSGRVYSFATSAARTAIQRARNPGYKALPTATIFFGDRGIGEFNDTSLFDLSLTYAIPIIGRVEPWLKFDVRNALNDDTLTSHNTGISADPASALDADGLRTGFTRGAAFGTAGGAGSYTTPREYFVSAGIRF